MSRWRKWTGTSSLRTNYLVKAAAFVAAVLIIAAVVTMYIVQDQQTQAESQRELVGKMEATEDVRDNLNRLFYHVRSYYSFQNETDLIRVNGALEELQQSIGRYDREELNDREAAFASNLESFLRVYEEELLPQAVAYVDDNDYAALRTYTADTNSQIDQFFSESEALREDVFGQLQEAYSSAITESNRNIFIAMALGAVIFFAMIILSQRMMKRIVMPLEELTTASDELAAGRFVHVPETERADEIGSLSRSFANMARQMQENEDELTAQNEELTAQQEMLEEALDQTEYEKQKIDRYSQLNQTMSTKLDKQEFLNSIFVYVNELYPCSRSMLLLLEEDAYRAMGMSVESIGRWINADKTEWLERLQNEPHILIRRNASEAEAGIAEGEAEAVDYYAAVRGGEGDILGIYAATRYGRPYGEEEMEEIESLLSHVGLGLERSLAHEEITRSRKLSQDILDNVNEAIQFVDRDGTVLQVNQAMKKLLGARASAPVDGWNLRRWKKPLLSRSEDTEELEAFFNWFCEGSYEGTMAHQFVQVQDQERRVFVVYGTTVYDDSEALGTVFVYRDMTREYELDQMKSELVSTVSHELRTPLSSVLGFTELLLNRELKPERQKRYLTTIHKEAKRLTNLINDFLDLQRMESGSQPYTMEDVRMEELVMDVLGQFRHEENHRLSFADTSVSTLVEADKERLQQVLTNLISNAIKFSPGGGDVVVQMENSTGALHVSVKDEGLGIPEHAKASLFQKFQRVDEDDRQNIGGTGLGLAICREIIERHGGRIWVESEPGEGSVFTFRLPLKHPAGQGAPVSAPAGYPDGAAVMIVEDDASLALLLSEELKSQGFQVIHHLRPDHAYQEILESPPAAVVVDLMLGEKMDGWDLVDRLKQHEETKRIPIIISSALDRSDEKMAQYGLDQYLTKPYPPQDLSAALKAYLAKAHADGGIVYPES
ncbi:ATP-binding protein [Alkalicoccus urumqiensis]|uniref:histidine kinase n=1 Tax=Alkalicoccus urumqiensis TaxID=1548213 RepID=A0A2P6MK50_ALKUR|nr:ATP-binding protein [Alkalicoccus urumqiensis]PRO66641.1 histidine kinase [Alkalicoccus urumqiensis]